MKSFGSLRFVVAVAAISVFSLGQLFSQEKSDKKEKAPAPPVVSEGTIEIGGQPINYQSTTGVLVLKDGEGNPKAEMFFIAYTKKDADPKNRPITFAFNGGPGSSSVWLHMGMLGPKRVRFPDSAQPLRPPFHAETNPHCFLDLTDLVFIDPVSTGYSRPTEGVQKGEFHGYEEDVNSVGQFIHDYVTQYQRWSSPKFLCGESYGGIRAAGLAGHLQSRYNLELNGIVVVSGAINFQTLRFGAGNDLPNITYLPTYTGTAWYHQKLAPELQQLPVAEVVRRAEKFAEGPYAQALLLGDRLPQETKQSVAKELATLTGLSEEFVLQSNLRISQPRFGKELLRDRGRTVGRFDSRYVGIDRDNAGEDYEYDASGAAIFGPFTSAINDYLRGDLKYIENDRVYEILTGNVQPWSYRRFEGRYVDATETLRQAMTANPYLKLFVAGGYQDLATPHFAMQYTIDHLGLETSLRNNITFLAYEGGHMMYIYEPSMAKLKTDLTKFYREAVPAP